MSTLQGDGPFTVFAPTDTAFQNAGIDLSTFDTDEENATLVDILTYHVYAGAVQSSAVTDGLTVAMFNGDDASFSVTDGTVKINDATVTTADVVASNGVIHIIDTVLMPPEDLADIPGVAQSTGVHTALVAALSQANLVSTLQGMVRSRSSHQQTQLSKMLVLTCQHLTLMKKMQPLLIFSHTTCTQVLCSLAQSQTG